MERNAPGGEHGEAPNKDGYDWRVGIGNKVTIGGDFSCLDSFNVQNLGFGDRRWADINVVVETSIFYAIGVPLQRNLPLTDNASTFGQTTHRRYHSGL